MTKGIQYAIAAVQDIMLAQVGVRGGPAFPPDKIAPAEPFSVCMAGTGTIDYNDGLTTYRQTLRLWLTVAHKDTPRDDAKIIGYGDTAPMALWASINLSGTVDAITAPIRVVGYGPWQINGMPRYGWAWEIDVLITVC